MDGLKEVRDSDETKSKASHIWDSGRSPSASVVTVNALCLIGAIIGISAIFLPWLWTSVDALQIHSSLAEYLAEAHPSAEESGLFLGGCVFIIGTGIAVVLPVGSILQAFGLIWFLASELDREARIADSWYSGAMDGGISYGFYLGVLSLAIVVTSVVRPSGPGLPRASSWRAGRLSTSTKIVAKEGGIEVVSMASVPGIVSVLGPRRRWVVVLVVVCLISGVLTIISSQPLSRGEPVVEVQGGVEFRLMDVGVGLFNAEWTNFTIWMHDGAETINWTHQSVEGSEITESGGVLHSLSPRNLSGLWLRLELMDFGGEGLWSAGDVVTILLEDDVPDFIEGTVYDIAMYPPSPMALDVSYAHIDVAFSFTGDQLRSEGMVEISPGLGGPDTTSHGSVIALILLLLTAALAVVFSLILKVLCGRRPAGR